MGHIINPLELEKGLRADFMKSFNNAENPADVMDMIMKTTSSSNKEKYGWLGQVAQLIEWKDERVVKGLNEFDYEIPNISYESTLGVDRDDMEDDQLGGVKLRINDLAKRAKTHPRKLFYDALIAGATNLCYDGQAFFSTSHSEGDSGTQSNLLTGTGSTVAQLKVDLNAAISAMRSYKDDQGEPFNEGEMKLKIVAPVALEGNLRELLNAQIISNTTNTLKGIASLELSSRLTDANDWYLINTAGAVKPFIMQERRKLTFEALEKGEKAFMSKKFHYGVDYRVGFGYGLWQKAVKTVNS